MRDHFFLHYGWFFQNLGKEAVRTFMHTTVSRGLYILYPNSKNHFFVFKEVFSENSVLLYGLYSKAACNQERLMMARVRYANQIFLEGGFKILRLEKFWYYNQFSQNVYCVPSTVQFVNISSSLVNFEISPILKAIFKQ